MFNCCSGKCNPSVACKQGNGPLGRILGAIMRNHNALRLIALMETNGKVITHLSDLNEKDQDERNKVTELMKRIIDYREIQDECVRALGFDASNEVVMKSETRVIVLYQLNPYSLFLLFEMDKVNIQMFNFSKFITTNEPKIIELIEQINEGAKF